MIVAMPNKVYPDGQHHDVAHPINGETRKLFEDAIIEEYNNTEDVAATEEEN